MSCLIAEALTDRRLLGGALGNLDTWETWRTVLKAAFGSVLNRKERRAFAKVAGSRKPPTKRVAELWAIAGRRSGKSRMAAAIATYIAAFEDHSSKLAPGEVGYVLVLSPSKSQARAVRDYCGGFCDASPDLAAMVESTTADEIRLSGGIVIATHASSYRTVRGKTLLAVILDESAFFRDEASANPDLEIYRAVLPALATTGGMLVGISSPYRRIGLLYQKHRDHFGQDGDVLVIQAPSLDLNPTIDRRIIERARKNDPEAARAEWDADFRSDLSALLDDAVIEAAINHDRPLELSPRGGIRYAAFTDASAGRHDAFTLCIGHLDGERFVADVVRGRKPPFDPSSVAAEYAALALSYGCRQVVGDAFAGDWTVNAFKAAGVDYERSAMPKSGLYLEAVPAFMRGAISIPNDPELIRELRLLERRVAPSGKDRVDHGQNGSDDKANALVGALSVAGAPVQETTVLRHVRFGAN